MDMTHITEFAPGTLLLLDSVMPMQVGAGSVDPELIEPHEAERDIEEFIAFASL